MPKKLVSVKTPAAVCIGAALMFIQGLVSARYNIVTVMLVGTLMAFGYSRTIARAGNPRAE